MTYGSHVNTDLMGPSCLQPAFDVGILSETFQDRIMRNRVSACTLTGSQDSHLLAVLRMPSDRSVDHTFIQAQIAVNNGPVAPVDGMVLQLLTETVVCRIGLGDHQGSGGVPVDPVYDSGPQHSIDPGQAVFAVVHEGIHQGITVMAGCRVHNHPFWLVYYDQVCVFIQDIQRDILRFDRDLFRLRDTDGQNLPTPHLLAGF